MKKIMVVDDNVTNLNVARKALETEYQVFPMPSGVKALKILPKANPDLILLDIEMPEMDGFEVIQQLKGLDAPINEIPVIFVSGKEDDGVRAKCIDLGAVDFILKPFEFDFLLSQVEKYIRN